MSKSTEEGNIEKTMIENQSSANQQSMLNTISLQKVFGPRLDSLTNAIEKASISSERLSLALVFVGIIGLFLTAVQIWAESSKAPNYEGLDIETLGCISEISGNLSEQDMLVLIKHCKGKELKEKSSES